MDANPLAGQPLDDEPGGDTAHCCFASLGSLPLFAVSRLGIGHQCRVDGRFLGSHLVGRDLSRCLHGCSRPCRLLSLSRAPLHGGGAIPSL